MTYTNFRLDTDADGILTVTWDMPQKSMNVFDMSVLDELARIIDDILKTDAIKGVIITSGKEAFSGGADLNMLSGLLTTVKEQAAGLTPEEAMKRLLDESSRMSRIYRRLETCGKPVVAAINGTAVGGAFELVLACHARIVADDPRIKLGCPEVKVGLMAGAGGTQRIPRLAPTQEALTMLLRGEQIAPARAKALNLVDQVVPAGELLTAARRWLKASPRTKQPWDEDGFKVPGGKVYSAAGANL